MRSDCGNALVITARKTTAPAITPANFPAIGTIPAIQRAHAPELHFRCRPAVAPHITGDDSTSTDVVWERIGPCMRAAVASPANLETAAPSKS